MRKYFTFILTVFMLFGSINAAGAKGVSEPNDLAEIFVLDRLYSRDSLLGEKQIKIGDLLILDRLFDYPEQNKPKISLGDLFVLDQLFSRDSKILDPNKTTIGDLLILDQLFANSYLFSENNTHQSLSLGELFIFDRLFSNNSQKLLTNSTTSLGDLFILVQLLND